MPAPIRRAEAIAAALVRAPDPGDGPPTWWFRPATPADERRAAAVGLVEVRRLHQMRRTLPLEAELTAEPGPPLRPFDPRRDVEGWLAVNNRAFAFHPDQGGWTRATLEARMAEDWFDPADLLVHDGPDGDLDGFCWTKLHPGDPPLGEIYVIGVDPERHGTGLGRGLVVAGLGHLWDRYGPPIGMLWVEADNEPALRLYRRLGFRIDHDDAAFALLDEDRSA